MFDLMIIFLRRPINIFNIHLIEKANNIPKKILSSDIYYF